MRSLAQNETDEMIDTAIMNIFSYLSLRNSLANIVPAANGINIK